MTTPAGDQFSPADHDRAIKAGQHAMNTAAQPAQESAPRRKSWPRRHKVLTALAGILVIGALGQAFGGNSNGTAARDNSKGWTDVSALPVTQPAAPAPAPAVTTPAARQYTPAQQQAITSAESYLSDGQGFSRAGLISQLDSPDGEGFSASLANFAVGHVQVSWRRQAAISARGYMSDGQGFSYDGLVAQLDSPYGGQFTYAQAVYGAKAAGL